MGNRAIGCIMGARLASKRWGHSSIPLGLCYGRSHPVWVDHYQHLWSLGRGLKVTEDGSSISGTNDCEADWTCHSS